MNYFHTYCVIITILFVYVIKNNCFDEFDKEENQKCINEINERFDTKVKVPGPKNYAVYAFLHMRISDDLSKDTFHDASNNSEYKYAKQYYLAIRNGNFIQLGKKSVNPVDFCKTTRVPCKNLGQYTRYERCINEMETHSIPLTPESHESLEVLYWIYDHMVLKELENDDSTFIKTYLNNSALHLLAHSTIGPIEFCARTIYSKLSPNVVFQ